MMPQISGWEICRQIRAYSNVPVIMLTAKSADPDIVTGLEAGADDYITKPFSMAQLHARIEAVLRRTAPERPRPFRVPFVPVFPILGIILCIALMLSLPVLTWIRFIVWLLIGLVIYFFFGAWNSKLRGGVDTGPTEDIPPPIIKT